VASPQTNRHLICYQTISWAV